jgi:hypothetical protein
MDPMAMAYIRALMRKNPTALRSAGLGAAQGATLGFADEIEAAARTPFSDDPYSKIKDAVSQRYKQAEAENPKSYLAGEIGGGLSTAFIPGAGLAGVGANAGKLISAGNLAKGFGAGAVAGAGMSDASLPRGEWSQFGQDMGIEGGMAAAGGVIPFHKLRKLIKEKSPDAPVTKPGGVKQMREANKDNPDFERGDPQIKDIDEFKELVRHRAARKAHKEEMERIKRIRESQEPDPTYQRSQLSDDDFADKRSAAERMAERVKAGQEREKSREFARKQREFVEGGGKIQMPDMDPPPKGIKYQGDSGTPGEDYILFDGQLYESTIGRTDDGFRYAEPIDWDEEKAAQAFEPDEMHLDFDFDDADAGQRILKDTPEIPMLEKQYEAHLSQIDARREDMGGVFDSREKEELYEWMDWAEAHIGGDELQALMDRVRKNRGK